MEGAVITIKTFFDPVLANNSLAVLEANGIPCFIPNEYMPHSHSFAVKIPIAKLKVFERNKDRCLQILAEDPELQ